jgi:hypothetical protein
MAGVFAMLGEVGISAAPAPDSRGRHSDRRLERSAVERNRGTKGLGNLVNLGALVVAEVLQLDAVAHSSSVALLKRRPGIIASRSLAGAVGSALGRCRAHAITRLEAEVLSLLANPHGCLDCERLQTERKRGEPLSPGYNRPTFVSVGLVRASFAKDEGSDEGKDSRPSKRNLGVLELSGAFYTRGSSNVQRFVYVVYRKFG